MSIPAEPSDRYDLGRLSMLAEDPRKVMLFIDAEVPQYDIAAGYFIVFEYLKIFLKHGYKILYWPYNRRKIEPYTGELQQMDIEVIYGDVSFQDFIKQFGPRLDIAIICRPEIAGSYLDQVSQSSKCKIIYFAHDLHYLRLGRLADVTASEDEAARALQTKEKELGAMSKADVSLFLSEKEIEFVEEENLNIKTAAVPWIQDLNIKENRPFEERRDLVFLGGFLHSPNVDAVKWLHQSVFPRIMEKIPGVRVLIIGSNIPGEIEQMDSEDFKVVGFVEDLDDYLGKARVFIAPLRFGAGIKGKITMALSYGLPVVTTGIGAEGMGLIDYKNALIADEAEDFAAKVAHLYKDKELWESISVNSINHIAENFSSDAADRTIMAIIDGLESRSRLRRLVKNTWKRIK